MGFLLSWPQDPIKLPTHASLPLTPDVISSQQPRRPLLRELCSLRVQHQPTPSVIMTILDYLEEALSLMLTTPIFVYTLRCLVCTPQLQERLCHMDPTKPSAICIISQICQAQRRVSSRNTNQDLPQRPLHRIS